MRSLRLLALVLPGAVLPSVLIACEDSGSSSGGTLALPEAGPGFEAGTIPDSSITPPPPEAGPDVAPKGVSVTVIQQGAPLQNIRIIAHDASGAVIGDVKTGATGKASFAAAPSMVTVLDTVFGGPVALTYLGVADGDALIVTRPDPPPGNVVGTYDVTVFPFGPASEFALSVGGDNCGAFTTMPFSGIPIPVDLYPQCLSATNAVLLHASNGGNHWYDFKKGVAKPAMGARVAVGPMNVASGSTAKLDGAVPAGTNVSTELRSVVGDFAFFTGGGVGAFGDGGVVYPIATGFADAYQSRVVAQKTAAGPAIAKGFVRRELAPASTTPTLTFDLTQSLPFLSNATLAGAVPARSDVTLTAESSLASADGGMVSLEWSVPGGVTQSRQWMFVVPPSTTTFKLPALPADAPGHTPGANLAIASVAFVEASQLSGYAQLKALPLPITSNVPFVADDTSKALPATGTVKVTAYGRSSFIPPID